MRPGPNNNKRQRGRGGGGGGGGGGQGGNQRRPGMPGRMQTFDSNGPDVRIRGSAYQVHEKYLALARDAQAAGDRIMAENYLQHAEHYFRIIHAQEADQQRRYQEQGGQQAGYGGQGGPNGQGGQHGGPNGRPQNGYPQGNGQPYGQGVSSEQPGYDEDEDGEYDDEDDDGNRAVEM